MFNTLIKEYTKLILTENKVIKDKAHYKIREFIDITDEYYVDLKSGVKTGSTYKRQLTELSDDIRRIASYMISKKIAGYYHVKNVYELSQEIIKTTGFWNRPLFLKKDKFIHELDNNINKIKKEFSKFLKE